MLSGIIPLDDVTLYQIESDEITSSIILNNTRNFYTLMLFSLILKITIFINSIPFNLLVIIIIFIHF